MSDDAVAVTVAHEFAHDPETLWLVMSDPETTAEHLPGCRALERTDGEKGGDRPDGDPVETLLAADADDRAARTFAEGEAYEATVGVEVGDLTPAFDFDLTVTERDYPRMALEGSADARVADLDLEAVMTFEPTEAGVRVAWHAEADVGGALGGRGEDLLESAVRPVPAGFFENVEAALDDAEAASGAD